MSRLEGIGIIPGRHGYHMLDRALPEIGPHDVECDVLKVGFCPTDEAVMGADWVAAPEPGRTDMIAGHETVVRARRVGDRVTKVKPGGVYVMIVRSPEHIPDGGFDHIRVDQQLPQLGSIAFLKPGDVSWIEAGLYKRDGGLRRQLVASEHVLCPLDPNIPLDVSPLAEGSAALWKLICRTQATHNAMLYDDQDEMVAVAAAGKADEHVQKHELTKKKVLLVGPTGGAGLTVTLLYRQLGYDVYAVGRRPKSDVMVQRLEGLGVRYFQNTSSTDGPTFNWNRHMQELAGEMDLGMKDGRAGLRYIFDISGTLWPDHYGVGLLGATGVIGDYSIPCGKLCCPHHEHHAPILHRTVMNTGRVGTVNFGRKHMVEGNRMLGLQLQDPAVLRVVRDAIVTVEGLKIRDMVDVIQDKKITKGMMDPAGLASLPA